MGIPIQINIEKHTFVPIQIHTLHTTITNEGNTCTNFGLYILNAYDCIQGLVTCFKVTAKEQEGGPYQCKILLLRRQQQLVMCRGC